MDEYLYKVGEGHESRTVIIVLPDIYGQTNYTKATCQELNRRFGLPVYLLDYFYQITNHINNISGDDKQLAHELMEKFTGQDFLKIYNKALTDINRELPNLSSIIIIGFCFAGRLAYLAAANPKINLVFSFYGAGAHLPGFIDSKSAVQYLISKRSDDKNLRVISFYGKGDESILKTDRDKTELEFEKANINYSAYEYDAKHAFFQPGRENYNPIAARKAWEILKANIQK